MYSEFVCIENPRKTRCFPNSLNSMKLLETIATHEVVIPDDIGSLMSMTIRHRHALHKRLVYSNTNDPEGVVRTSHAIQPSCCPTSEEKEDTKASTTPLVGWG